MADTRSDANQSFFVYVRDPTTGVIRSVAFSGDVQVGLDSQPADLTLLGRLSIAGTNYDTDNVNKGVINATSDDTVIAVNLVITPITNRISVYLPPGPRNGELHFIKDMTGTAATVPIDIFPASGFVIDGQKLITLNTAYGSLALVWLNGSWRMIVAGLGPSSGGGAPITCSFVTINPEPSLTANRQVANSANIKFTDGGPKSTVFFDLSEILGAGAGSFTNANVTVDAYGRITAISNGGSSFSIVGEGGTAVTFVGSTYTISSSIYADASSSYVVMALDTENPNERKLTAGTGISIADGGPGGNVTISATGATSGTIYAFASSSYLVVNLDAENPNERQVVGTGGTRVIDGGAGSTFTISSSIYADTSSSFLVASLDAENPNERVVAGTGGIRVIDGGAGGTFLISGSIYGDVSSSYVVVAFDAENPNERKLTAGTGISIADGGPGGNVTISATGATSGTIYADVSSSYLVVSLDAENPNERRVIGEGGTQVIDGGPGSTFAISSSIDAFASSSFVVVSLDAENPNERKITAGTGISIADGGAGGNLTISATGATSGTIYADASSSYLVASLDAENPNERKVVAGTGISIVDGGPGGNFTITAVGTPSPAGPAAYYGFVTSSVWWLATGSWTPFVDALPDATVTDVITQSIIRVGSTFIFANAGMYAFHANFNAYGSDAYISLRLNGVSSSQSIALERSTYRTTPADQNPAQLDGIFTASAGDIWTLEYVTSGTTFAWTGSNPLPSDGPMHTGEVSIFLLSPSGSTGSGSAVVNITGSGGTSVTSLGGVYTVSSSVGADLYASYLVASASAEDPNARVLAPGTGVSLVDNGPGSTLVINISGSGSGLPTPNVLGDLLVATTPAAFVPALPITTTGSGWLVNNLGYLMVASH